MDYNYLLFLVLGFLAVFLFIEGAYAIWDTYQGPEAKRIEKRLLALAGGGSGASSSIIKQRLLAESAPLQRLLLAIPRIQLLDRFLLQSGLQMNVALFLGYVLLAVVVAVALATMLNMPFYVVIAAGAAGASIPWLYVKRTMVKRREVIEQQLPEALDLMSRAMLAGHAFPSAMKMVGDEMPEPIAGEFRITFDEVNYGISVPDALNNMLVRVPSTDMSYFVISVLLQRETGGNLAELLGNLARLIRERLKLIGTVRVLSAEGRLSAQILTALPFVLAFVINIINPGFMKVLWTDPTGLKMVGAALVMIVIGYYWMRRIVKIRI